MAFNIWAAQGRPAALTAQCNPSVIYEGNPKILGGPNVFKMWCGRNNGATGIDYFESAAGTTSWSPLAGNPVIPAAATNSFPTVYKVGSTYYCYHGAFPGGSGIFVRTSSDGITWSAATLAIPIGAGTWESTGVAQLNLVPGTPGFGTGTGETYYAYYEGVGPSGSAEISATSTDLINWTKGNVTTPIFTGVAPMNFQKIGSLYYAWAPNGAVPASLSSQNRGFNALARWSASNPLGPWTVLTVPGNPSQPAAVIYPSIRADFDFSGTNTNTAGCNVSDPWFVSALGNMYVYWTLTTIAGNQNGINMALATAITPAQQVSGYEGMQSFPMPMFDGNLNVLGSDPGTGVDANPIGGNWTPWLSLPNQRVSNLIESVTAPGNGISWWNAVTWPNDQWSSVTIHSVTSGSIFGSWVRTDTSGANTRYEVTWSGNTGNNGTLAIIKTVAGASTTLAVLNAILKVSAEDVLMLVISGTNLLAYYNGFPVLAVTDASIATGSAGLRAAPATLVTNVQISSWRGGQFQANPFSPPSLSGSYAIGSSNRCCSHGLTAQAIF